MSLLKSSEELDLMRIAGGLVAEAFDRVVVPMIAPGISTEQIDHAVRDWVQGHDAELIFFQYRGFPAYTCISVNEEIVHGIPSERLLEAGDMVTVDIGLRKDGFCGDSARTFEVGEVEASATRVRLCCEQALQAGIDAAQPYRPLEDVSRAIQERIEQDGLHVIKKFVGHGIGREMHEEPQVPNFVAPGRPERILEPGMVLAIEPMVAEKSGEVDTLDDGWTVVASDGGFTAHCEHTVAITAEGPEILTRTRNRDSDSPA